MLSHARLLGLVSAFALVASAGATTTKLSAFVPAQSGVTANSQVDGTGTIKFNPSTGDYTRVHLEISDLQPNTQYSILVEADFGSQTLLNAFTTNGAGHAVLISDTFFNGDLTGHPLVTVFIWDQVVEDGIASHTGDRATLDFYGETRAESVMR